MIYQPPKIQHRGVLQPVLDRLVRESFQLMPPSPASICVDWRVERLQRFINTAHGKLGWNLNSICKQLGLGVSGSHGARLFKKHTGIGIREYAKRKRLAVAADKLKNTTISIKEIAADLGYKSQTDLSRQFKQQFCLNPTEFRIAYRQAERPSMLCHGPNVPQDSLVEANNGTYWFSSVQKAVRRGRAIPS